MGKIGISIKLKVEKSNGKEEEKIRELLAGWGESLKVATKNNKSFSVYFEMDEDFWNQCFRKTLLTRVKMPDLALSLVGPTVTFE